MASKQELYDQAQKLDIAGRSNMDKGQLEAAIAKATGSRPKKTRKRARRANPEADRKAMLAQQAEHDAQVRQFEAEQAAARAEAEAEAAAQVRTGPQQALDRAKET